MDKFQGLINFYFFVFFLIGIKATSFASKVTQKKEEKQRERMLRCVSIKVS